MFMRSFCLPAISFAAVIMAANLAWALGEGLGETKEQLNLDYEASVKDHDTGRVTVVLMIADEGKLEPLTSVNLVIPSNDGTGRVDLSLALAIREVDGKQVAKIHLLKEMAEQAEIQLRTSSLDGKQKPLTWYYYAIPIAEHLGSP